MTEESHLAIAHMEVSDPAPLARDLAGTCRKARAHLHCGLTALAPGQERSAEGWIRASLAELGTIETFLDLWACAGADSMAAPGTFDLRNVIHDLKERPRSPGEPKVETRFDTAHPLPIRGDRSFYESATRILADEIGANLGGSASIGLRVLSRTGCHVVSFRRTGASSAAPWKPRWQGLQLLASMLRERGSRLDWDRRPPQIHLVIPASADRV